MPPKKIQQADLYESVHQLTETVNALKDHVETFTRQISDGVDQDDTTLKGSFAVLARKVDALDLDAKFNDIDENIKNIKDVLLKGIAEENVRQLNRIQAIEGKNYDARLIILENKEHDRKIEALEYRQSMLEKTCNVDGQRMRERNLELHGFPNSIEDDDLEPTAINLFESINVYCEKKDIQGVHRLPARKGSTCKPVIIKFVNRKLAEEILEKRTRFRDTDFEAYDLPPEKRIFVNLNLSPALKELDFLS